MKTTPYAMSAVLVGLAMLTSAPTASAHDADCTLSIIPPNVNLAGCPHLVGHIAGNAYGVVATTAETQCDWAMGNPVVPNQQNCPVHPPIVRPPF